MQHSISSPSQLNYRCKPIQMEVVNIQSAQIHGIWMQSNRLANICRVNFTIRDIYLNALEMRILKINNWIVFAELENVLNKNWMNRKYKHMKIVIIINLNIEFRNFELVATFCFIYCKASSVLNNSHTT